MSQSPIEQAIAAGAEWMEANKNHPDADAFACVAQATGSRRSHTETKKKPPVTRR